MQTKMHSVLLQLCIILGALSQVSCQDSSRRRNNGYYRNVGESSQIGSVQETQLNIEKPLGETRPLSLIPSAQNIPSRKRKRTRARRPKMDAVPVHEVFSGGLVLDRRPNYNEQPPEPDIDVAMGKTNDTSGVRKMVVLNLPDIIETQIRAMPKPLNTLYLSGNFKDLIKPPAGAFFPKNIAGSTLIGLRKITHSKIQVVNVTQPPVQEIKDQQQAFPMIRSQGFKQGAENMNSPYALMDTMGENTPKPKRRKLRRKKITTSNIPLLPITIPTVHTQKSFEEPSQASASQPSTSSTATTRRRKGRRRLQNNQNDNTTPTTATTASTTQATRPSRRTTATVTTQKFLSTTSGRESWEEDSDIQSSFEPLRRFPSKHSETKSTDSNDKTLSTNTKLESSSNSHIQHSSTIPSNIPEETITQLVPPFVPDRRASSRILGLQTKSTRTSTYSSSNHHNEKLASTKLASEPTTKPTPSSFRGRKAHSRNLQRNLVTTSSTNISDYNSFSTVSPNLAEDSATDLISHSLAKSRIIPSRTTSQTQPTPLTSSSPLFPSYIPRKKFSSALQQSITISTSSPILTKDNVLIDNVQHLLSTTAMPPNSEQGVQTERDYTINAFHHGHKMPVRRFRIEATSKRPSLPIGTSIVKVQHQGFPAQRAQPSTNLPFRRNVSRFPAIPREDLPVPAFIIGPTVPSARFRQRIPFSSALVANHDIPTSTNGAQRQPINRWQQEFQKNHRYHSSHQQNEQEVSSTFPPTPYYHEEIGQRK